MGISESINIPLEQYYSDKTPVPVGSCPVLWPQHEYTKEEYEEIVGQHNVHWMEALQHYILTSKYSTMKGFKWTSEGEWYKRYHTDFLNDNYEYPSSYNR